MAGEAIERVYGGNVLSYRKKVKFICECRLETVETY
jgi:hypothetical protein